MALSGGHRFGVAHGEVFPHGCYAVAGVEPARDYDRSTRDSFVQGRDEKGTGCPVWLVQVMDADPEVRGQAKTVTVKVGAERQPVLPDSGGLPFTLVEFTGLTVTPYVDSKSGRLAYSLRAGGLQAPVSGAAGKASPSAAKSSGGSSDES